MSVGIYVDPEEPELGRVETTHFTRWCGTEKLHVIGANNARRRQHELVHAVQVVVEEIMNVPGVVTFNLVAFQQLNEAGPCRLVNVVVKIGLIPCGQIKRIVGKYEYPFSGIVVQRLFQPIPLFLLFLKL